MSTTPHVDEEYKWNGTHKPWMRPLVEPNATLNNSTQHPLNRWDQFFLSLAEFYAQRSKDPSTKCGAIIARGNRQISQGFNGFPMLVNDDPERYQNRELKLQMIIHAEINAILFAKVDLTGTTIYTWPFPPCCRCAAVIIQSGIRKVVAPAPSGALEDRWAEELRVAKLMYSDAGVELVEVSNDPQA